MSTTQDRIAEIRLEEAIREAKIVTMWPTYSTAEIAKSLGMTKGAVTSVAYRNGLTAADRVKAPSRKSTSKPRQHDEQS